MVKDIWSIDCLFDEFFVELEAVSHPEGSIAGVDQHAEGHVGDPEGRETPFGMNRGRDPFREVGAEYRCDACGVLTGDDNHPQE